MARLNAFQPLLRHLLLYFISFLGFTFHIITSYHATVGRSGYRYGGQGSEEDYDMLGTGSGSGQGLSPRGSQSRRGSITKGR